MADDSRLRAFVAEYMSQLTELTTPIKSKINSLTMLAAETAADTPAAAPSIVAAVEKRILSAEPPHKLPALYLLDSIVKNAKEPYIAAFARNLPQVFAAIWDGRPGDRRALERVLATWDPIFPAPPLAAIRRAIAPAAATELASQPAGASGAAVVAADGGMVAVPALVAPPGMLPSLAAVTAAAVSRNRMFSVATRGSGRPESQPSAAQAGAQSNTAYPPPPALNAAYYGQPPEPQPNGAAYPYSAMAPLAASAYPGYPQTALPPPALAPGYATTMTAAGAPAAYGQLPGQIPGPHGSGPAAGDPLAPALQALLATLANGARPAAADSEAVMKLEGRDLKVPDDAAVQQLMEATAETRRALLDRVYLHNRRLKSRGGRASRAWYISQEDWLKGAYALSGSEAANFFAEEEATQEQKQGFSVPADDSQPLCALSGERFELFWNEEDQRWHYRDAVRLDAEQAARYNLPEGAIVLVSALGGPADEAAAAAAADAADADEEAAELAGAAAAEGVAPEAALEPGSAGEAPGLDVKSDKASQPGLHDALPGLDIKAEPAEDVSPAVKQEQGIAPPAISAEGRDSGIAAGAGEEGIATGSEPEQQQLELQVSGQEATVKPDLEQLDAAHDAVLAAAADSDAAGVVTAAQREANALAAAGAQPSDPRLSRGAGHGSASASPVAADASDMKEELLENAEASAPTHGGTRSGPAGAAGRRVQKKRTRWGEDVDEPADHTNAGDSPVRSVRVKAEPQ